MILSIDQLTVRSGQQNIIQQASLSIPKGAWYALVGQSGSGKTLLAQALGQMLPPNLTASGRIQFKGEELLGMAPERIRALRGRSISYVFQDYHGSFTPFRRIGQHFDEVLKTHTTASPGDRKRQALEALVSIGLGEELYSSYPSQLSGGQLQRVSIALALLLSPDLLIADEITTALDSVSGHTILQLLASRQQQTGCTILFITHDWRHVKRYADRIAVMKSGEIVESGSKHVLLDHPKHPYTRMLIQSSPTLPTPKGYLLSGLKEVNPE
ncbi:oligopeptide ABC transporter ATP-binding protein [Paenibacillus algicola]|uniref:Oligopeptide ABC transporter ATP-binding protein n=1 Tax=Paenibacillus algicola TaxID=2565926 RepID=A0A4P8XPQ3_9BACL|nr:ABC transporter ATP-binding protein [Paenibacillus algicola]QCT04846.1 oligopeptide ABC transporter ATP-binding protein [Paenibacillus algicola]